jgi:hypothetical protein
MDCKFCALLLIVSLMGTCCHSQSGSTMPKAEPNAPKSTDSTPLTRAVSNPLQSWCRERLSEPSEDESEVVYSDSLPFSGTQLFFLTRDSTFYAYQQTATQCELLLEQPIDRDLYSWTDGSQIVLADLDGDAQKEVLVQIFKNKNQSKYWVFRLLEVHRKCVLKKIERFEELMNPEWDPKTGFVRSSWGDKYGEGVEFYQFKADRLTFVKGTKSVAQMVNGEREMTDTEYTTKAGW